MGKVKFKDLKKQIKGNELTKDDYVTLRTAYFITMNVKEKFIQDYLDNWKELILDNCTVQNHLIEENKLLSSNKLKVNSYILNDYKREEINEITSKLSEIFRPFEKEKLNMFMKSTNFHRNDLEKASLIPDISNITDYAICQLNDDVIVFHLDENYKLGITISSIFKKEKLTNPLDVVADVEFFYKIKMTDRMNKLKEMLIKEGAQDTLAKIKKNGGKEEEAFRLDFHFNKDEKDYNDLIIGIKEDFFVFGEIAFAGNKSLKKKFRKTLEDMINRTFNMLKEKNESSRYSIAINISHEDGEISFS